MLKSCFYPTLKCCHTSGPSGSCFWHSDAVSYAAITLAAWICVVAVPCAPQQAGGCSLVLSSRLQTVRSHGLVGAYTPSAGDPLWTLNTATVGRAGTG